MVHIHVFICFVVVFSEEGLDHSQTRMPVSEECPAKDPYGLCETHVEASHRHKFTGRVKRISRVPVALTLLHNR